MSETILKLKKTNFQCVINKDAAKTKYDQGTKLLNIEIPLKVIGEIHIKAETAVND